ncbi:hypothetical protein CGRA01v4_08253 [Colletotrichum graminicola]|nr:hypothetical protein CGRA01v4_08253 [Colletotrichum graminicola]
MHTPRPHPARLRHSMLCGDPRRLLIGGFPNAW